MYRSTQQHLVASNALPDEKMSQISPSAEDAEAVGRANANPNLYRHRGGEFSLSESFEFVHNTLTCSEIDDHCIRQKEGSQDSDLQAPDPWTQMYVKIMDDVRIALATALVPVIHTQVRRICRRWLAMLNLSLSMLAFWIQGSIKCRTGGCKRRRGDGSFVA